MFSRPCSAPRRSAQKKRTRAETGDAEAGNGRGFAGRVDRFALSRCGDARPIGGDWGLPPEEADGETALAVWSSAGRSTVNGILRKALRPHDVLYWPSDWHPANLRKANCAGGIGGRPSTACGRVALIDRAALAGRDATRCVPISAVVLSQRGG